MIFISIVINCTNMYVINIVMYLLQMPLLPVLASWYIVAPKCRMAESDPDETGQIEAGPQSVCSHYSTAERVSLSYDDNVHITAPPSGCH